MEQYVVEVTIISGSFTGWKGFAMEYFKGELTRIAEQSLRNAGKFSLQEANEVAAHFNSNEYPGWLAVVVPFKTAFLSADALAEVRLHAP